MTPLATWYFFISAVKNKDVSKIEIRQLKTTAQRLRYRIVYQLTMKEEMIELLTARGTPLEFANVNTLINRLDIDGSSGDLPPIHLVIN